MPRKLEAGLEGRYLILRVLITSTMKSEPGTPPMREVDNSFGVPLSAAAICIVGGSAEGRRGTASVGAVVAACAGGTAVAAPATAAPARNLRRLSSGCGCFRAMRRLPLLSCAALSCAACRQRRLNRTRGNIIAAARPWEGFRHPLCVFNIRAGLSE